MLNKLAKKHNEWLRIAKGICNTKEDAEDLVQDMYIKMHESGKKYEQINKWYVYRVMFNQFVNQTKKKKIDTICIDFVYDLFEKDCEILEFRMMINEALNELNIFDRVLLLETHERSLRKNEKLLNIPVMTLHYRKHRALEKIKRTETIREFRKL